MRQELHSQDVAIGLKRRCVYREITQKLLHTGMSSVSWQVKQELILE